MEDRIKAACQQAVRVGLWYWEALAADLDARLCALLCHEAVALSASPTTSRCETLRGFHRVTPSQCLLMGVLFPGRVLLDASFGLRFTRQSQPGRVDYPEGVEGPVWALRLVLEDGLWKVDPFTEERDWSVIGQFTIEAAEPVRAN
jgi:hypothetical protein